MNGTLEALRHDPTIAPHVTAWRTLEPKPAHHVPAPEWLHPALRTALAELGIDQLYTHQSLALQAAARGEHIVVATGTASGKSLCYHLPVLQVLLEDPSATALYLFPTKALAHDQRESLHGLVETAFSGQPEGGSDPPWPQSYDGDTASGARPRIRRQARAILSNPDMLHAGILPRHPHWQRFFRELRYVILDELHVYRGLFGSHVANVLRRLRRICRFYGSQPTFLCTSATIANPGQLAEQLLETPATVIEDDGAPRGRMHFLLYNPPLIDPQLGLRRSLLLEASQHARRFLEQGLQTVVFVRSRMGTELLLTYLRKDASGLPRRAIRGYRGGYLPRLRREIEAGLREGRVRCVVATNALELGVDIGTLSACVMAGYPGTIASTWQQAGRAGRRDAPAVAMLVAGPGPLDQYLVTHPEYFFGRSAEQARINPNNPLLLAAHLRCAASELAFEEGERFGRAEVTPLLDYLAEEGSLLKQGGRYFWIATNRPAVEMSLRTASGDLITIVDRSGERAKTLGQVDRPSAPLLVYPGGIYLHEGRAYQVKTLDWEGGVAQVRPAQVDYYTQAHLRADWEVANETERAPIAHGTRHHGDVHVHVKATTFRKVRLYTHETLGWGSIDLPAQEFLTQAFWLTLPWMAQKLLLPDYGPNWPEQRRRARERDGFNCRHCQAQETATGREHDVHHIVPFRNFGYAPGENDAYLQANDLGNLITLCRSCHARVDHGPREGTVAALQGLGHLLRHVVPLFLMCDLRDIRVTTRLRTPPDGLPVALIYDDCPGGAGLSPALFDCAAELLQAARSRAEECPCDNGCPSCVGPIEEAEGVVKERVVGVLKLLCDDLEM